MAASRLSDFAMSVMVLAVGVFATATARSAEFRVLSNDWQPGSSRQAIPVRMVFLMQGAADSGFCSDGAGGLAQQDFRMTENDEVLQFADALITQLCIETLRILVEVRHADEHIRRFPEDPCLGEFDQRFSYALSAKRCRNADELNVTDKRALHADHEEARRHACHPGQVALARAIAQQTQPPLVAGAEGDPWLGFGHDVRRPFSVDR